MLSSDRSQRLEYLYERYGTAVRTRCRRLLRDESLAEDATQEIFLRVLRHIESAPDEEATLSWIYRISTNYCLNMLRNGQRQAEPTDELPEGVTEDFEASFIDRDFALHLLGRSRPEVRAPVELYHLRGMEQGQIARTLGVSRRTVTYRLGEFVDGARKFAAEHGHFIPKGPPGEGE